MRSIPRALALGLILIGVIVGAVGGALVGRRLAAPDPTATPPAIAATAVSTVATPRSVAALPTVATPLPASPTRAASPSATPVLATTSNSVGAGQLKLTATYASIGIELFFLGDDNGNAVANVEFRPTGAADWRAGLPLWRTVSPQAGQGRAFYGSVLLLDAGKPYELRITLDDPDGVRGDRVVAGAIATRADNAPAAASLKPTHYVSPNGNDIANGSGGSPWRTIDKALKDAPSGAVVQVAPGSYAPPTTGRKDPITLVAQRPAVDDNREPINAGARSVIEPQAIAAPNSGTWTPVTFTGPATGGQYTVWKWTTSPVKDATRLTIATDRGAVPQRIASWASKSGVENGYTLQNPEGWAEVLYRNQSYNFGFIAFGNDIYARLPGDRDPNEFFATALAAPEGGNTGRFGIEAPQVRLTGFELRSVDVWYGSTASKGMVDHNLFLLASLVHRGDKGDSSKYSTDQLVEQNRFIDTGTWSVDPAWPAIPWNFIKAAIKIDGKETGWSRVGAEAETTAVGGRGGARGLVVRRNTIEGFFNGAGGYNEGFDRYAQQDNDLYENLLRHIGDDAFEPEQQGINWRIWGNRLEYTSTALSTGPLAYGPVYFFRNEIWKLGSTGVGADGTGSKGVGVVGFKYSGSSAPAARIFVIHNTFWTDEPGADGGNQYAGGGPNSERFYLRNNIFRTTRYVFAAPANTAGTADHWDEDYNYFATPATDRGLSIGGNKATVEAYRAASGQGAHSNRNGDFHTDPGLADPATGNLALATGSPQIDAGVPVPNISDRPGVDYQGNAPDLGAREGR